MKTAAGNNDANSSQGKDCMTRKFWHRRSKGLASSGAFLSICILLCGCSATRYPVENTLRPLSVQAEIGQTKFANVGDTIFVKGSTEVRPALRMSDSIHGKMPGSMSLPFDFSIEKCDLILRFQTKAYMYYCAPYNKCDARHSMLGKVIRPGDSVGVRLSKLTGQKEWFVDNSVYNGMETIWARPVRNEDGVTFLDVEVPVFDSNTSTAGITFDGFFNNLINFTLTEREGQQEHIQQFHYNPEPGGGPTKVSFKGMILEVLSVDNLGMKYRWISLAP